MMLETENLESRIVKSDYKILIVDDVMSNVLLLKILLTNEKYQVCTANCGNMCIEQAKAEKPDLILLDVMMPDISGFDAAQILKKDPETAHIPIIFLTALNNPSDLVHGFQVGANDFLTKPFNKEELVVRAEERETAVRSGDGNGLLTADGDAGEIGMPDILGLGPLDEVGVSRDELVCLLEGDGEGGVADSGACRVHLHEGASREDGGLQFG